MWKSLHSLPEEKIQAEGFSPVVCWYFAHLFNSRKHCKRKVRKKIVTTGCIVVTVSGLNYNFKSCVFLEMSMLCFTFLCLFASLTNFTCLIKYKLTPMSEFCLPLWQAIPVILPIIQRLDKTFGYSWCAPVQTLTVAYCFSIHIYVLSTPLVTVISAHWATMNWSWPKEWNLCAWANLPF